MTQPRRLAFAALATLPANPAAAQFLDVSNHRAAYVLEAGALHSFNQDLQGYRQSNATSGWDTTTLTARAEAWLQKPDSWNYGLTFQPLVLRYSGIIQSQINARGKSFSPGTAAELDYVFPSVRATVNYDVWPGEATEARIGVTLAARYIDIRLSSPGNTLKESGTAVFPLLNLAFSTPLAGPWGVTAQADFFPADRGQGFYDVFGGLRYAGGGTRALEVGARAIWGGFVPETPNNLGNRTTFAGLVARFIF